jgi:hypothetical protein
MAQAQTKAQPLDVGEKYLAISVLGQIKLAAFKNKNKKDAKEPDYSGNGVAVWINEKKADIQKVNQL